MSNYETSPHVLPPQQQRSREALARIVDAAERLLRAEGIDGFSMAAVALASGLPIGNIYRRFRGKDDLLKAIKEDVTRRIEHSVLERLSQEQFRDVPSLVRGCVDVLVETFRRDESLHGILFDRRVSDPVMNQIGYGGRQRIFAHYREALMPLLPPLKKAQADMVAKFSFHLIAATVVGKARADDAVLNAMSWKSLGTETAAAATAYLATHVNAQGKAR